MTTLAHGSARRGPSNGGVAARRAMPPLELGERSALHATGAFGRDHSEEHRVRALVAGESRRRYRRFRHILIFERRDWPDRLIFVVALGVPLMAGVASRLLLAPRQLPVGALTALVGVPIFLLLMLRQRN